MAAQDYEYDLHINHETLAVHVARLQEQHRLNEHRTTVLERTFEKHLDEQNKTNERLYSIAYSSFNQIKQAKYWVAGAIFGVGIFWALVTNLDKVKAFLT